LPPFLVERDHLAIENDVSFNKLLPHPIAEVLKPAEHVSPLGSEVARAATQVEQPAETIVLGLKQPFLAIKRLG
jgi:hypothetical protein